VSAISPPPDLVADAQAEAECEATREDGEARPQAVHLPHARRQPFMEASLLVAELQELLLRLL
jgi:hypothetical protein